MLRSAALDGTVGMANAFDDFQMGFAAALEVLGWEVEFEAPVTYMADGEERRGRVGLVARKAKLTVAFEFDRDTPQPRSRAKLEALPSDLQAIVCRSGAVERRTSGAWEQRRISFRTAGSPATRRASVSPAGNAAFVSDPEQGDGPAGSTSDERAAALREAAAELHRMLGDVDDLVAFIELAEAGGWTVFPNIKPSTGRFLGLRLEKGGFSFRGGELGLSRDDLAAMGKRYDDARHREALVSRSRLARQEAAGGQDDPGEQAGEGAPGAGCQRDGEDGGT